MMLSLNSYSAQYTWKGTVSTSWNDPANWSPSTGVPGISDRAIVVTAVMKPVLEADVTITELVMNSGELNLGGFTLFVTGITTVNGGFLSAGVLDVSGTSCKFSAGSILDVVITGSVGNFYFNGAVFNGAVSLTKTDNAASSSSSGGNTFNGPLTIVNNSSKDVILSSPSGNVYNNTVSLSITNSGSIYPSYNGANFFNDHVTVSSSSTTVQAAINFGTIGSATLAVDKKIVIGNNGFINGTLVLRNLVDLDTTPLNIELSGTARLSVISSTFHCPVQFKAPNINQLQQSVFNSTASFEKYGASTTAAVFGGNVFMKAVTFRNSGTSYYWRLGWNVADQYNDDLIVENSSSGFIGFSRNTTNTITGDLYLSCNSTGGILFGEGLGSLSQPTTIVGDIKVGQSGINSGSIQAYKLMQQSTTAQNLTLSGGYAQFLNCTFNAEMTITAPQLIVSDCIFLEKMLYTKSGSANDNWNGGNNFNKELTINNNGTGHISLSKVSGDTYQGDVIINNNAPSAKNIYLATAGASSFKGNIILTNAANGNIYFSSSGGTATFEAGSSKTLQVSSFTSGTLSLKGFVQTGSQSQQITLGGTAKLSIGPSSSFEADVIMQASAHVINGCTFNGTAALIKTGGSNDAGTGGNIFKKTVTFQNSGTGYWRFASSSPEVFDTDIILKTTNTGYISMAYSSAVTFNGDLYVSNTNPQGSIVFGQNGGVTTLMGKIFEHPDGMNGLLSLTKFNQKGNVANSLILAQPSANIQLVSCVFDGPWTMIAPRISVSKSIFNESSSFVKTGTSNDNFPGGSTFKKDVSYTNNGAGTLTINSFEGDDIDGNLTLNRQGAGDLLTAHLGTTKLAGDISLVSGQTIKFSSNGGELELDGINSQTISGSGSASFGKLKLNKASGKLIYKSPLLVTNQLTFISGVIETDNNASITFQDNSAASGANDNSFVNGEVIKAGNDSFTFPIGANGKYRPLSISAPSTTTFRYAARYNKANPDPMFSNTALTGGLLDLSRVEYWTLNKLAGGAVNLNVTLSWNSESLVQDETGLVVAQWNGSAWTNKGGNIAPPTVTSNNLINSLSLATNPFTLGSTKPTSLPVKLSYFRAHIEKSAVNLVWGTEVEQNASKCVIERSSNGLLFSPLGELISKQSDSYERKDYLFQDPFPSIGKNYYRLKFVDLDDSFEYSMTVMINFESEPVIEVYPVPSTDRQVHLRLNFEPSPEDKIILSDAMGVNIGTISSDQFNKPISFYESAPSGVYFLHYYGKRIQKLTRVILH